MHKKTVIRIVILGSAIIGLLVFLGMFYKWNKPLGPSLEMPTRIAATNPLSPTSSPQGSVSMPLSTPAQLSTPGQNPAPTQLPAATSEPLCGGPAVMTILAIGSDQRGTSYLYGLADAIRIIRIDFITPSVSILDIPRDLWVEIPGISDHYGITHAKLNEAYFFGNPGMGYYDGPGEGPGLLARTLDLNFGLRVDHYLAIDMQTLVGVINAVGGVDIYVETPINLNEAGVTEDPSLYLSVGNHHLDGELAMLLARNRNPSTFQRARYQNMILGALRDKVFSPSLIPELPHLIATFSNSIQTDLSPNQINQLICLGQGLTEENINVVSFPEEMFTPGNIYDPYRNTTTFIYEADFNLIRSYLADFMNGTWPSP
jgi:LCP family protein required for cell wall assembly